MYLIYVNDFQSCLNKSSCILCADDTTLNSTAETYENLFQFANDDLIQLYDWLSANKLTINLEKQSILYILYLPSRAYHQKLNS